MRKKSFKYLLAALALTPALTACDNAIYDYDEECREGVQLRFVFDYNLEWANAFPSRVDCLTVAIYDSEGGYVTSLTETSEALADENYRMNVALEPGVYSVTAYGGMACADADFAFTSPLESTAPSAQCVSLSSATDMGTYLLSEKLLHDQFYGYNTFEVIDAATEYTCTTVQMIRNTNNFRILLKQLNGEPLSHDSFEVSITDDNTLLGAYDRVSPAAKPVTYRSWATGEVSDGITADGSDWTNVYAEISTSRLIDRNWSRESRTSAADDAAAGFWWPGTSSVADPRLVVDRTDGSGTSLDVNLINLLAMMASDKYANPASSEYMPGGLQEFLDRKNQWDITVILGDDLNWVYIDIVVNDWTVRINAADF